MTPPDVAALLARHPLEWSVEDGGVVYEETVELPYVGHVDDIVPALATALRAALADQRRYQYVEGLLHVLQVPEYINNSGLRIDAHTLICRGNNGFSRVAGLHGIVSAAIDAAMTADGGGV